MKLTRAACYALHAVAYMAADKSKRAVASHTIAKASNIPERFLLKVLKPLVDKNVLHSVKGPNGGYMLARPASQITLCEILEAVDAKEIQGKVPQRVRKDSHGKELERLEGPVHKKLTTICKGAAQHLRDYLNEVPLSKLVGKK